MIRAAGRFGLIGFDAGGTLIEPVEPVGETYARLARAEGIATTADAMERGFAAAFAGAPPLAAPRGASAAGRASFERGWWCDVVAVALAVASGDGDRDDDAASIPDHGDEPDRPDTRAAIARVGEAAFERWFEALFAHFARPAAWRVFPDAVPALEAARATGARIAIISNFDGRLHGLLDGLGLLSRIDAVVVSSEAGAAKPDAAVFEVARAALGPGAGPCLHVGDSLDEDARAARGLGWTGVWLDRGRSTPPGSDDPDRERLAARSGVRRVGSLADLFGT